MTFKNSSNTALYSVQIPLFDEEEVTDITGGAYVKPDTGIPASDLAEGVIPEAHKIVTISLTTSWTAGANGIYTQSFSLSGIGADKKIDLIPTPEIITQLISDGISQLYINNNNGVLTAISVGAAPSVALTIQAIVVEVESNANSV